MWFSTCGPAAAPRKWLQLLGSAPPVDSETLGVGPSNLYVNEPLWVTVSKESGSLKITALGVKAHLGRITALSNSSTFLSPNKLNYIYL